MMIIIAITVLVALAEEPVIDNCCRLSVKSNGNHFNTKRYRLNEVQTIMEPCSYKYDRMKECVVTHLPRIQSRNLGDYEDFNRPWVEYEAGFGSNAFFTATFGLACTHYTA